MQVVNLVNFLNFPLFVQIIFYHPGLSRIRVLLKQIYVLNLNSRGEEAMRAVMELVVSQLEAQAQQPSSAMAFPITFLRLATAVPSIFRFAPAFRLAEALERLKCEDLLLCIFLADQGRRRASSSSSSSKKESTSGSDDEGKGAKEDDRKWWQTDIVKYIVSRTGSDIADRDSYAELQHPLMRTPSSLRLSHGEGSAAALTSTSSTAPASSSGTSAEPRTSGARSFKKLLVHSRRKW